MPLTDNAINSPIHVMNEAATALKAINPLVNAQGGQLSAGGPQVDRAYHSSVPIKAIS